MKKVVTLIALNMLMAGCVSSGKVSVNREQLQHHHFVLQSVDGKAVTAANNPSELSFDEDMTVSGRVCNQFHGQDEPSDGGLRVKDTVMTRMMCADPQLSALDGIVSEMFKQDAQVDPTANQPTLAIAEQTLTHKLADLTQEMRRLSSSHNFWRQVTAHYSVCRWVAYISRWLNHPVDE